MLLTVDVGNTITDVGMFEENELLKSWSLSTNPGRTSDEYGILILNFLEAFEKDVQIEDVIISCVVPPLMGTLSSTIRNYFDLDPLFVKPGIKTGMPILLDNPQEVGADRIVNAVAVKEFYRTPAIVVDFGTATTFDVISREDEYLGGLIAPGPEISANGLNREAARLPKVEIKKPESVIGKNTVESMQSGLFYGSIHMIEGTIESIEAELGYSFFRIATGGGASLLFDDLEEISSIDKNLTLKGLNKIFQKNI